MKTTTQTEKRIAKLRAQWLKALDKGDGDRMFWLTREINRLEGEAV